MKQNIVEKKKVFGGETEFVIDYSTPNKLIASKQNRHFHQRMLRAYLRGRTEFNFGRDQFKKPITHSVLVKFI